MAARATLVCLALAAIFACGDAIRSQHGDAIRSSASGPMLYLSDACTFSELAARRDPWMTGGGDEESLVDEKEGDEKHADMADAPALAMKEAAPELGEFQIVGSSETSAGGEVVVIGQPGSDTKEACLKALGIRSGVWSSATLEPLDVQGRLKTGFNAGDEDDEGPGDAAEKKQILAVTEIMSLKLRKNFEFNFRGNCVGTCDLRRLRQ